VEKEKIVVEAGVERICRLFQIDPYSSISEGTLIITCRERYAPSVVARLNARNIKSSIVGELTPKKRGLVMVEFGREMKLEHPIVDPFWNAFYNALQQYRKLETD